MIILLILCLLLIFLFIFAVMKNCSVHKKIIEKFNEEMYIDMSGDEKVLYFKIIEIFNKVLKRSPSIDELYSEFKKFKNNNKTSEMLEKQLVNSDEYKKILKGDEYFKAYHSVEDKENEDHIDEQEIKNILIQTMPFLNIDDVYNSKDMAYLIMRYRSLNKNKDNFKNHILLTQEYSDYCKIYEKRDMSTDTLNTMEPLPVEKENVSEAVSEEESYAVPILASSISSTPLSYNLNRPDINNRKQISIKKECKFNDEFTDILNNSGDKLAKRQIKRNFDELMYHCHKEGSGCELNYKNIN